MKGNVHIYMAVMPNVQPENKVLWLGVVYLLLNTSPYAMALTMLSDPDVPRYCGSLCPKP